MLIYQEPLLLLTFGGMLRLRTPTCGRGWRGFCARGALLIFFLITRRSRRQLQDIMNDKLVSIL